MDKSVHQLVRERAAHCCEYCHLSQDDGFGYKFHIEHIRARQHGGGDSDDNLALACTNCNWNKGPNLSAVDPASDQVVPLFNPRKDIWSDRFTVSDVQIMGLTPIGRATARLLRMNAPDRTEIRRQVLLRHGAAKSD